MFGIMLRDATFESINLFWYDHDYDRIQGGWVQLTPETYAEYMKEGVEISIDHTGEVVSHNVFKETLIKRALKKAYGNKNSNSYDEMYYMCGINPDNQYRNEKGRFIKNNMYSKKVHLNDDEFVLLRMVCGSCEAVAKALGISRQTVWRRTRKYMEYQERLKKYEEDGYFNDVDFDSDL